MDSTSELIFDSLQEEPIGETDHFIWFITDIGIVALFKKDKFSILEAYVDKKFIIFFLHDVSNWKLKWRKINLNLKFLIFFSTLVSRKNLFYKYKSNDPTVITIDYEAS